MRRALFHAAAGLILVGGLVVARAAAQGGSQPDAMHSNHHAAATEPAKAAAPAAEGSASTPLHAAIVRQIAAAQEKLVALADAMPAEKYTWRPGEGVRSTGEVYMHVASANFFLPTFWGVPVPAGVDPRNLEKLGADKAKTVAALKQSFDHLRHAVDALPDADLGKAVTFFGRQATVADVLMVVTSHGHEHLGQAIAYARSNGVVPPWSGPQAKGD